MFLELGSPGALLWKETKNISRNFNISRRPSRARQAVGIPTGRQLSEFEKGEVAAKLEQIQKEKHEERKQTDRSQRWTSRDVYRSDSDVEPERKMTSSAIAKH
jgi:hypothetical protein